MDIVLQVLFSGCALGMVYALVAFGYQLTFATSKSLNFGQGEALAVGALIGLTISQVFGSYWLMIPAVLAAGALLGIAVERIAVRPALDARSEGWIMTTIAMGIILKNLAENLWGKEDMRFAAPVPDLRLTVGAAVVTPMEILVVVGALAVMAAIELFNRKSIYGKAVVATAADHDAAGLMGIDTRRVITFSYALSFMTAAFAGILVAPLTMAGPNMGTALGLKAFAVAIVGGLTSGVGAIVGGLLLGVSEVLTGVYVSTGYKEVPGLVLLLVVLALKPAGLFGRTAIKKV